MSDIEHMQETQEFRVPMRTAATSNWAKDGKRLVALIGKDDALYLGDEDAYHTKVEKRKPRCILRQSERGLVPCHE